MAGIAALAHGSVALASPTRAEQQVHTALQLDADASHGAKLYVRHCAACHGATASGDAAKVIPALAGQRKAYLVKQLADFSEFERQGRNMHAVVARAAISEPQAWADIAAHLNGLPPAELPETGDGSGVELGEAIYHEQCASCHDEDARGDDDGFAPSLRNQHYAYLVDQLRKIGSWHRLNADEELVRFLDSLDTDELTAVADYLSRMRGPVKDRTRMHDDGTVGD